MDARRKSHAAIAVMFFWITLASMMRPGGVMDAEIMPLGTMAGGFYILRTLRGDKPPSEPNQAAAALSGPLIPRTFGVIFLVAGLVMLVVGVRYQMGLH